MTTYAYRVEDLGPYAVDPMAHEGIARHVAARFRCANLDREDLVQEAMTVLCAAARNYDESKGAFSTWAGRLISCHLIGVTADFYRAGRFGSKPLHRAVVSRLRKAVRRGEVTDVVGARACLVGGWGSWTESATTEDQARRALDFVTAPEWRLDAEVSGGASDAPGDHVTLLDRTPDAEHADDTEHAALMAAWERVLDAVPANDREREILDRRLLSDVPDTLKEIGDRWGLTRERVRQIEEKLIARLHDAAVAAGLREAA